MPGRLLPQLSITRHVLALLACGVVAGMIAPSARAASTFVWNDNRAAEPAGHVSFVRDYQGRISFEDHKLRALVDASTGAGKRWSAVDVVMQQCFGGGFINDLTGARQGHVSISTSADWNQVSWTVQQASGFQLAVLNYTASWVQAASTHPDAGMRELAFRAREGDWTAEAFQPWVKVAPEFPQYASRDAQPGGANDLRTLTQQPNERIFTATAVFGERATLAARHNINAARVQQLMIGRSAAAQMAFLYDPALAAVSQGTVIARPDTTLLPDIKITGGTDTASVERILDGTAFAGAGRDGDRLLLYTTGHGGQAYFVNGHVQTLRSSVGGVTNGVRMRPDLVIDPNAVGNAGQTENAPFAQREAGSYASDSFNPNMFGDRDDVGSGLSQLQLSFSGAVGSSARFAVNGVDFSANARRLTTGIRELPNFDENQRTPTPQEVWQIDVPFSLLTSGNGITVDVTGLDERTASNPQFFYATSVWQGDREWVTLNGVAAVPEPATWLMWLAGLGMALRMARRRQSHDA